MELDCSLKQKICIPVLIAVIALCFAMPNTVAAFTLKYRTHVPGSGVNPDYWLPWINSPLISGTANDTGLTKNDVRVNGYISKLNVVFSEDGNEPIPKKARIELRVFRADTKNWEHGVVTKTNSGSVGNGFHKIFAIQMALLNALGFGIKYNIEWPGPQDCAWTEIRSDGQLAGHRKYNRWIRNIKIWIYKKNDPTSVIDSIDFNSQDLLKDQHCKNEPKPTHSPSKRSCDGTPHNSYRCRKADWQDDPNQKWTMHKCDDGDWIYGNVECRP